MVYFWMPTKNKRSIACRLDQSILTPSKKFKQAFIGLAVFAVIWQFVRVIRRTGVVDFTLHWEHGRRLLAGEFLYKDGIASQSAPFNGLVHAPLALLPEKIAHMAIYPLTIIAAIVLFGILRRVTSKNLPLNKEASSWLVVLTLTLSSRFIIRELLEGGINMALVALAWLSVYYWRRKQEVRGGLCLGIAIGLKHTPALFLLYFAWKRQWKMVIATTFATVIFMLSPILIQGPDSYSKHMSYWYKIISQSIMPSDATVAAVDEDKLQNIALRPALTRFFVHLPEGHPGRLDHPVYFDFFNLSAGTAGTLIILILLIIAGAVAWVFRQPVVLRDDTVIIWECAAISLLILLYSPITWGHHCVGTIPALYMIMRTAIYNGGLYPWMWSLLGFYTFFILLLNRSIVGKNLSYLLDSYHMHTWSVLALLIIVLAYHSQAAGKIRIKSKESQ